MTTFMLRVRALLDGHGEASTPPRLTGSVARGRAAGAHRQGEVRALAEQLVCEANAVLDGTSPPLELTDEPGDGQLTFTIRCGPRFARVHTTLDGAWAVAHLEGGPPGDPYDGGPPRELADEEQVAGLVLGLLVVPT